MKRSSLFPLSVGLGALGLVLGRLLYALATDDRGLLVRNHPLSILLCLLIPVALVVAVLAARKADPKMATGTGAAPLAAVGLVLTAVSLALSILTTDVSTLGGPGKLWCVLGVLSTLSLLWGAGCDLRGKETFFACDLALCLFLLSHLVSNYRLWCADPQILDYLFEMLGTGTWMLFAYYCACARVGLGKPRMHLATGLLTVVFCLAALGTKADVWLCLGGTIFATTCLARPIAKKEAP